MAFLEADDIGQVIYNNQVNEITEGNDGILLEALNAAVEEVRSYLTPDLTRMDGTPLYDVDAILATEGDARNPLIRMYALMIARYHLIQLSNYELLYNQAQAAYDRAVAWFKAMNAGTTRISTLPTVPPGGSEGSDIGPFEAGSRAKFNHDY